MGEDDKGVKRFGKVLRQSKIIELVKASTIETQEELTEALRNSGLNVTQATVSRDIRELNLTKAADKDGRIGYMLNDKSNKIEGNLIAILQAGALNVDYSGNMVVIKTIDGLAMAVASAVDAIPETKVLGTIAGDNTIFCLMKNEDSAVRFISKLKRLLPDGR